MSKVFARRNELAQRTEAWQKGEVSTDVCDAFAELGPPDIPTATSQAPKEAMSVARLLGAALFASFASLVLAYLLDLPFSWLLGPEGPAGS